MGQIRDFFGEPKCTERRYEKVPDLSHLAPIWPSLEPNVPSLGGVWCMDLTGVIKWELVWEKFLTFTRLFVVRNTFGLQPGLELQVETDHLVVSLEIHGGRHFWGALVEIWGRSRWTFGNGLGGVLGSSGGVLGKFTESWECYWLDFSGSVWWKFWELSTNLGKVCGRELEIFRASWQINYSFMNSDLVKCVSSTWVIEYIYRDRENRHECGVIKMKSPFNV